MNSKKINELTRDYLGTYEAWKEAVSNKDGILANDLRFVLIQLRNQINLIQGGM
jgi:hypothetical protein